MFVPLGFFLCALVDKYRSFWRCLGAVAVIMTTVELIQLFTLLGYFDADDLILNLTGAAIGWLAAKKSGA
jgi:glycopeptide antibiotics resistance protein